MRNHKHKHIGIVNVFYLFTLLIMRGVYIARLILLGYKYESIKQMTERELLLEYFDTTSNGAQEWMATRN